jgi:hypothetical protein
MKDQGAIQPPGREAPLNDRSQLPAQDQLAGFPNLGVLGLQANGPFLFVEGRPRQ